MNSKIAKTLVWLMAPVVLIIGIFFNRWLVAMEGDGRVQACLLVDDIAKDTWQALHYGTSQGLLDSELQLTTYSFSQSWLDEATKRNPCPIDSEIIVNAWLYDKFAALGSTGRLALIGNSFGAQLIKPDFRIGAYFQPHKKAQLIADFINTDSNGKDSISVALVLGPDDIGAVKALREAMVNVFNQTDFITVTQTLHSADTKFEQYLAMSQLLVDEQQVDYIVATPTGIEQATKIITGRELENTGLISLAVSKAMVSLMEQQRVTAVIDDKPILQGKWLASWLKQEKITERPEPEFEMFMLTPETVGQIAQEDSLVPYGYRVIYNSGN